MKKTILIATALFAALAWTGCRKIEEEIVEPEVVPEHLAGSYILIVEATKDSDTKALSLDASTLNAYWGDGEKVAVYLGGTYKGQLTATPDGVKSTKATLAGELESVSGVAENTVLTLLFPRAEWDYTGQDGAEPDASGTLATKYDYATASVTVATVDNMAKTITTTGGASFVNQQSMYRFGFLLGGAGEKIEIKEFTVSSANNALVQTRTWSGDAWIDNPGSITVTAASALTLPYASLRNTRVGSGNGDTYSFSVIGSDDALYLGSKDIPSSVMDTHGKFISAQSISVTKSAMAKSGTVAEVW